MDEIQEILNIITTKDKRFDVELRGLSGCVKLNGVILYTTNGLQTRSHIIAYLYGLRTGILMGE